MDNDLRNLINMLDRLNEVMQNDNNVPYKIIRNDNQEITLSVSEIRLLSKLVNDILTTVISSVNYYKTKTITPPTSRLNEAIGLERYIKELELN